MGTWPTSAFLTIAEVRELLYVSSRQGYAVLRSGDLPAIQIGGRGVWRIGAGELEAYIQRHYRLFAVEGVARRGGGRRVGAG